MIKDLSSMIMRNYVRSLYLTIYSYVKPGAIHRFAPTHECELLMEVGSAIIPQMFNVIERSFMVGYGEMSIPSMKLGEIIANALKEARIITSRVPHDFIIVALITTAGISYTLAMHRKPSISNFKQAEIRILRGSTWQDAKSILKGFKSYCPTTLSILDELELSEGRIEYERINLEDLFTILASKVRSYYYLLERSSEPVRAAEAFIKTYEKTGNIQRSVISAYLELLEGLNISKDLYDQIRRIKNGNLSFREIGHELIKLDQEFRKRKYSFDYLLIPLFMGISMSLASYMVT